MHCYCMRRNVLLLILVFLLAATACQNSEQKFRKHLDVAQVKIFAGEYEVARIEVLNALKIDPSSSRAYFLMSQALAGMKDYQGAVRALANANELAPDNREIALEYDQLLYAGRAYSLAESLASIWTTRSPEDRDFLTLLSLTQARLGKASDAVETASRMVDLFPGEAASWLNMARVTLIIDDQEAALEALGKAEKLDPDSIEVSVLRVDLLVRQGRTNEAVNHLEVLTSSNPDRQDLKVRLARLYEDAGRKSDAVRVYQEIAQVEPEASVLYRLGVLFI
jgi:tetratricopeptide (TPR) repeat protein